MWGLVVSHYLTGSVRWHRAVHMGKYRNMLFDWQAALRELAVGGAVSDV